MASQNESLNTGITPRCTNEKFEALFIMLLIYDHFRDPISCGLHCFFLLSGNINRELSQLKII